MRELRREINGFTKYTRSTKYRKFLNQILVSYSGLTIKEHKQHQTMDKQNEGIQNPAEAGDPGRYERLATVGDFERTRKPS